MKRIILFLMLFITSLFSYEVTVSILPQKYFVEKIAKDKADVNVMVKPGASPATYEPKTSQMRSLSKSKAYFYIGVPFENVWLEKFKTANKKLLFVDTAKGIEKIEMKEHSHEEEGHDDHDEHKDEHAHKKHEDHKDKHDDHDNHDDHEEHKEHKDEHAGHDHGGLDPHIWLDPILVKTQAKNILNTLVEIDKKNEEYYKVNYKEFLKELDELNKQLNNILKPHEHKAFMVFHPSWGYFAKRYELEQIAIEVQGKEPKPAQLVELIDEAKEHNIKIVFVSPQFSEKGAKIISKGIKGNVAIINPLSLKWKENLINTARQISKTYEIK